MSTRGQNLGAVLVTGGTGFLGTHLVKTIHSRNLCTSLTVLDLHHPTRGLSGVNYVSGSITSITTLKEVFERSKPDVIFHTASPNFTTHRGNPQVFYDVNVKGTQLLLGKAREYGVKAFVFTSSSDVYAGDTHINVTEDAPKRTEENSGKEGHEYAISKVLAEEVVLREGKKDDGKGVKCVIIRPTHLYGEGDTQAIPVALDACASGKPLVRLGNRENLFDILSLDNCSAAHILAAQCLLYPDLAKGKVAGEAFTISDGPPVKFWDFITLIWSEGRGRDITSELWVMPEWCVWFLCSLIEWCWWVVTLGRGVPRGREWMERAIMIFVLGSHFYDGSKAERVLGYKPVGEWRSVLRESVRWEIERRKESNGLGKKEL